MNTLVTSSNHSKSSLLKTKREDSSVGNLRGRALSPERHSSLVKPTREVTQKFLAGLQRSPSHEKPGLPISPIKEQEKEFTNSSSFKKPLGIADFSYLTHSSPSKQLLRVRARTDLPPVQQPKEEETKKLSPSLPIAVPLKLSNDAIATALLDSPPESKSQKIKTSWSFFKKSSSSSSDEFIIEREEKFPLSTTPEIGQKPSQTQPAYELICEELNQTEITFNHRLKTLLECKKKLIEDSNSKIEDFFNFINEKKGTEKGSKNPRNGLKIEGQKILSELFNQVSLASNYSDLLLENLKSYTSFKEKSKLLGGLMFNNFSSMIKSYAAYTEFQKKLRLSERAMFFKKTDHLIPLNERSTTKLNFEGFAANLMQRLVRYEMFINQLLKETQKNPELIEETKLLETASKRVKEAANNSNEALRHSIRPGELDLTILEEEMPSPKLKKSNDLDHSLSSLSTSTTSLKSSTSSL
jgi:RhoGEF domain